MNADTWKKVKQIFGQALEIHPRARTGFLNDCEAEVRLEVLKMLEAIEQNDDSLDQPYIDFHDFEIQNTPSQIGDYKILREVGNGGMGVVYEALRETAEFKQRVALKVIKRGMNNEIILKRFHSEQQILAQLEHPNIGRFLDGGKTAEGLPFYAMEFIEGLPIDEYFQKTALSINEKLNIFREVCAAVSFAHTNLIVHRDLKPSNIVVAKDKTVKLLDFGIAKVLDVENQALGTATQFGMMTPQYASPEQIRGEQVTTRSDVYSLGLILYEILCGKLPYQTKGKTYAEILQTVTNTEPVRPSAVEKSSASEAERNDRKLLKGDLDSIVLKALEKDTSNRYQSVEQLSEDLRKHSAGFPISARPHDVRYRLAKYYQRNKTVAVAGLLLASSLLFGVSAAIWQSWQTGRQKELAEKRFSEVRKIANNVIFKYHDEIEKLEGSTAVREILIQDAIQYLDNLAQDAENDIELEHELALAYLKLGDVQGKVYEANTGNTAGAIESYEKAIRLLENVVENDPLKESARNDLINSYHKRVQMMFRTNIPSEEKLLMLDKSLKLVEESLPSDSQNTTHLSQLAMNYILVGDSQGALPDNQPGIMEMVKYHSKALEIAERLYRINSQDAENILMLMRANQRIGTDFFWLGESSERKNLAEEAKQYFARALPYHQKAVELAEEFARISTQENQINRAKFAVYGSYAESLLRNGEKQKALIYARLALKITEEILAKDKANREALLDYSEAHGIFAEIYFRSDEYEKAVENYLKVERICQEIYRKDERNIEAAYRIVRIYKKLSEIYRQIRNEARTQHYQDKSDELNKQLVTR